MRLISAMEAKQRGTFNTRFLMLAAVSALRLALSGCNTTTPVDTISIDRSQGTEENIASLTDVIRRNPSDPEGYNVRGSAYGKSGKYSNALDDFNRAIQLNPSFYQAYANRALIHRSMGNLTEAANDYNRALRINPRYDVAYIGRGNLYRQAGRTSEAMNDFNRAISTRRRSRISRLRSRWRPIRLNPTTAGAFPTSRSMTTKMHSPISTGPSSSTSALPNPGPTRR